MRTSPLLAEFQNPHVNTLWFLFFLFVFRLKIVSNHASLGGGGGGGTRIRRKKKPVLVLTIAIERLFDDHCLDHDVTYSVFESGWAQQLSHSTSVLSLYETSCTCPPQGSGSMSVDLRPHRSRRLSVQLFMSRYEGVQASLISRWHTKERSSSRIRVH